MMESLASDPASLVGYDAYGLASLWFGAMPAGLSPYDLAMPNGGSDCCGECAFNPNSLSEKRPHLQPGEAGSCAIRGLAISRPFYTYCANFHTGSRSPDGPVFAGFYEFGRLPWHGAVEVDYNRGDDGPCEVCGGTPSQLALATGRERLLYCGPEHYLEWWRAMHPGSSEEYPWALHDAMFDGRRRASGRDAPRGVRERLVWWLHR